MKFLLSGMIILLSFNAFAYRLELIKMMDAEKKTFVIRQGKQDGVIVGKKATFTANDVSFLAKAIQTSREFSQWRILNPKLEVPFTKKDFVTYYDTTEYLWTLTPEENRQKYLQKRYAAPLRKYLSVYGGFTRGINQSYDEISNQAVERGGYEFEIFYDKEFTYNFILSGGLRFSRENQNFLNSSFIIKRMLLMGEATYYFPAIKRLGMTRFNISTGAGWGQSASVSSLVTQTGFATLLPSVKIGFEVPYEKYKFLSNIGIETISALEERTDGSQQSYQTTNAKFMFGIKFFI